MSISNHRSTIVVYRDFRYAFEAMFESLRAAFTREQRSSASGEQTSVPRTPVTEDRRPAAEVDREVLRKQFEPIHARIGAAYGVLAKRNPGLYTFEWRELEREKYLAMEQYQGDPLAASEAFASTLESLVASAK